MRATLVFLGTCPGSDLAAVRGRHLGRRLEPVPWRPVLSRECTLPVSQGSCLCPEMMLHLKTAFVGGNWSPAGNASSHSACAHSSGAAGSWAGAKARSWGRTSPAPGGSGGGIAPPPEPRPRSPRANLKATTFRLHLLPSRFPPGTPPRPRGRQAVSGAVSSDVSLSLNAGSPSSDI